MFRITNCTIFPVGNLSNMKTEPHKFPLSCAFQNLGCECDKSGVQGSGLVQSFSANEPQWLERSVRNLCSTQVLFGKMRLLS